MPRGLIIHFVSCLLFVFLLFVRSESWRCERGDLRGHVIAVVVVIFALTLSQTAPCLREEEIEEKNKEQVKEIRKQFRVKTGE
jgi:hypothetical protein